MSYTDDFKEEKMNSKIACGLAFLTAWLNVSCITSDSNGISKTDLFGNWLHQYPVLGFTQRSEYHITSDSVISRSWTTGTFVDSLNNYYENAYWTDTIVYIDWKFDGKDLILENGIRKSHAVSKESPAVHQIYLDTGFREVYAVNLVKNELRFASSDSAMDAGFYVPFLKQP